MYNPVAECISSMPMTIGTHLNAPAGCRRSRTLVLTRGQNAEGHRQAGKSSGSMPIEFQIQEIAPARCRWLLGYRKKLRHAADGVSNSGNSFGRMPEVLGICSNAPARCQRESVFGKMLRQDANGNRCSPICSGISIFEVFNEKTLFFVIF